MKIDSHQHYWSISRTDYGWLQPSIGRIYRDYLPEDLLPILKAYGVEKTILVQAAPSVEETEFLLGIADREESVAGVVGWLDFESVHFERQWLDFKKHPKFKGLRPMIQDLPSDWIVRSRVVEHIRMLAEAAFPIDIQANPRHLPYLLELLHKVPELHAVIDHLAKPPIDEGFMKPWRAHMIQIASFPNIMCKLSGMVPEIEDAPWSVSDIVPFAECVIRTFGKKRVMFGSDWPVCLYSATYPEIVQLFESCLGNNWTQEERADVYGGNAARFYQL